MYIYLGNSTFLKFDFLVVLKGFMHRCYEAILEAILPLLPRDSTYHAHEVSFGEMLPSVILLTTNAVAHSKDPQWIQSCKVLYDLYPLCFTDLKMDSKKRCTITHFIQN